MKFSLFLFHNAGAVRRLRTIVGVLPVILSGCQSTHHSEPWELSSYTGKDLPDFYRSELVRVAPELDRPDFRYVGGQYEVDKGTQRMVRSGQYNAVLTSAESTILDGAPYVRIQGQPAGKKGEMEISVFTGTLSTSSPEKFYRRKVIQLR